MNPLNRFGLLIGIAFIAALAGVILLIGMFVNHHLGHQWL